MLNASRSRFVSVNRYLVITPTILYVLPLQPTALPPEGIGHVIELQDVGVVEDCKDERTLSFLMPGLKKRAMHFQLRQSEAARRREEGDRKTRRTIHESGVLKVRRREVEGAVKLFLLFITIYIVKHAYLVVLPVLCFHELILSNWRYM